MKTKQPVELCEITMENFRECIRLSVADHQRGFVASNMYSLAEAKADGVSNPLAVYADDQMVGFTMYCFEPESGCDSSGLILPVAEYDHGQGCSITGGYVYRGSRYPQMTGMYFFGDFCTGNIWGLRGEPSGEWTAALLLWVGGFILGPIVQKMAFDAFWTGIPFGHDLTDNKLLIAGVAWLWAILRLRGGRSARTSVFAAAVITLVIFAIPHSTWGSQIDWEQLPSS